MNDNNDKITPAVETERICSALDNLGEKMDDISNVMTTKANETIGECLNRTVDVLTAAIDGFTSKMSEIIDKTVQSRLDTQIDVLPESSEAAGAIEDSAEYAIAVVENPPKKVSLEKPVLSDLEKKL